MTMFAAIEVGSYSIRMEIFEVSKRNGIYSFETVMHRMELGKSTFATGKIAPKLVEELCTVMQDFKNIMDSYQVETYRAFATSAVREAKNNLIVLEALYQRTGIRVEVLSNSEQRFLVYKGIASKESAFQKIIEKGTAILDVSGGSIQVSLFDKDSLIVTENVKLGSLRVRERLHEVENTTTHYEVLVEELIRNEVANFKKMHLKDRKITNVILVGNPFTDSILYRKEGVRSKNISREEYMQWYQMVISHSPIELAMQMEIPLEYASLMIPTAIINKRLIQEMEAENIWTPGVSLAHGFVYDYAIRNKYLRPVHDFEKDIVMASQNIGRRYAVGKSHTIMMNNAAKTIMNAMKKQHGLSSREKLLLEVAINLHDCGKYISLNSVAECSFSIIMSTEIIGLSHREREIIANVVKYNTKHFGDYEEVNRSTALKTKDYVLVARLTAFLRLVNALDQSHMQKTEGLKAAVRGQELVLTIETNKDFNLEYAMLHDKADFFEEVYNIRPVLKIKKKM